jgi:hypothetical protein
MNKDFSEYQLLIDSFAGLANKASFDTKYTAATIELSKTERFLLKMELKRLASPCTRCLDLRGLVDGDCQLFDFQGQNHFLDDFAIQVFQENAEIYQGYTFGVYEAVKNAVSNLRHVQQIEKFNAESIDDKKYSKKGLTGKKNQYPVKLFSFESYPNRIEERMNFAVPVTVALNDNEKIEVTSIDISLTGLKIKVANQTDFFEGDKVTVTFTGLEQEFKFNKNSLFIYQVQNILNDNDVQFIGLKRISIKENDSFVRFLANYIQGNKRRYKINLDNSINALQARSFEQFSLMKINELVVFMSGNNQSFLPRYVLLTKNNQDVYDYWRDEKKDSTLNFLVNSKRFDRLKTAQKQGRSLLVFSFIHIYQGHQYFYTIDDLQQADDELFFANFIAFAAEKESFKVTSLSYNEVSTGQAYSPYTTANVETKQHENLNPSLSNEIKEAIGKLSTIVTAVDLTSSMGVEGYKSLSHEGIDLTKLKLFGHKRLSQPIVVDEILVNYNKQRKEHRFKFKTPVIIECQSVNWSGISVDFSVSGLKLELDKPAVLVSGEIVNLTFPNLQKITSTFALKALPYKIVRINKDKTIVNLRVLIKEHKHIGRSFFKLLIDKNKEKLTPDEYAMLTPDLSSALRTMYAANLSIPTAIVQTSGSHYKIASLVLGASANASTVNKILLDAMSDVRGGQGNYNLHSLLNGFPISNLLDQELKKISPNGISARELIYITVNSAIEDVDSAISVQLASEFSTSELTHTFIRESLVRGKFYCLEVRISNSEEPKMEHLDPELNYISLYAIHRGKQLEDEIYSVAGVVELFDVTQETLLRNKLMELK